MLETTQTTTLGFTTQLHHQIEYSEVGVQRKTIFKDEQRQAVLVCLKAGTSLPKHTSGHHGFMTVIEGQGIFTLEDQEIALEPGVFIAMPAHTLHAVNAFSDLAFLKVVDSHQDCQQHPEQN